MFSTDYSDLQLFADGDAGEGADASGGAAQAAAHNAADAERQRLLELGVPEEKLNRRARYRASAAPKPEQDAAAKSPTGENTDSSANDTPAPEQPDGDTGEDKAKDEPKARMSWDEIVKDPEYNEHIQQIVSQRLKAAKTAQDALTKLTPALEILARKYGLDASSLDYDALSRAVSDDSDYYETRAMEMGVPVETAKRIDQQERDAARQKKAEQDELERQRIEQHIAKLQREEEEMKKVFPNFNLRQELKNPVFVRMTSPGVGLSVEDAYYAIHRNEIQSASMQAAALKTREKVANAIASNSNRPQENGTSSRAPSVTTFDYRKATREQREDLKRRIRDAAARGEKLYPGQ